MTQAQYSISDVQAVIDERRNGLDRQLLFARLDASSRIEDLRIIAQHLIFFTFGFQDMLRLTHERIRDSQMREIAAHMREGDAGHDQWFVHDLRQLDCEADLEWVFGPEHYHGRESTYRLIAEMLHAVDDRVRLVFLLVLEAAASVFFWRAVELTRRANFDRPLKYFASSHLEAEADHDFLSGESQADLQTVLTFDTESLLAAKTLTNNCFDIFDGIAVHLEHIIQSRVASNVGV